MEIRKKKFQLTFCKDFVILVKDSYWQYFKGTSKWMRTLILPLTPGRACSNPLITFNFGLLWQIKLATNLI